MDCYSECVMKGMTLFLACRDFVDILPPEELEKILFSTNVAPVDIDYNKTTGN
jgi:hypothetical protein